MLKPLALGALAVLSLLAPAPLAAQGETPRRLVVTGSGQASGAEFDIHIGHVWEVRDGQLVRGQGFGDRDRAREAAGLA